MIPSQSLGFGLTRTVTKRVHPNKRTHCKKGGHALEGANVYIDSTGDRRCRACKLAYESRKWYAEKSRRQSP